MLKIILQALRISRCHRKSMQKCPLLIEQTALLPGDVSSGVGDPTSAGAMGDVTLRLRGGEEGDFALPPQSLFPPMP